MKKKHVKQGKRITAPKLVKRGKSHGRFKFEPVKAPTITVSEPKEAEETFVPRDAQADVPERERSPYDGNTAFNLYLREVGQTKLLTIPEENDLAARIKKGDKKAREQMIKANLRLVVKIAREYEDYGMPLLDLINEGNMGLMKAVERFDPAQGREAFDLQRLVDQAGHQARPGQPVQDHPFAGACRGQAVPHAPGRGEIAGSAWPRTDR